MNMKALGAYSEFDNARAAICKIALAAMDDRDSIDTYRALLTEIGIRAIYEAEKLNLISGIPAEGYAEGAALFQVQSHRVTAHRSIMKSLGLPLA